MCKQISKHIRTEHTNGTCRIYNIFLSFYMIIILGIYSTSTVHGGLAERSDIQYNNDTTVINPDTTPGPTINDTAVSIPGTCTVNKDETLTSAMV